MLRHLYSTLLYLATPFFLRKLYKSYPDKPAVGRRWPEHFGSCPPLDKTSPIWIHAVSVGEVLAASEFIKTLHRHYPELAILLTTTTSTGAAQADKLSDIVEHRYMPLDFGWAVRRFLHRVRPRALFIMETELWPNTLHEVQRAEIPVCVLNARLSERSCLRYQKVQPLFNIVKKNIDLLLCQHQDDAERFHRLGVKEHQLGVTGSMKFDISVSNKLQLQGQQLRQLIGQRPVWIAASTHEGEDEQILAAFHQIKTQYPESLLILVPRHPERFSSVAELCNREGFKTVRRTEAGENPISASDDIYLGDTMGEMMILLAAADVAFVGGSLLGDKVGGHNLLEPAALAKPIITGPSYFNFTDITEQLIARGGCQICESADMLASQVSALFANNEKQQAMGSNALSVVKDNQGAIARSIEAIRQYL
ncbi:3-deoxy-D-manno-octulosonic-acid transferase [Photobacterium marinum]|uniref:3-deoxy-D-manno-octulosonic acid transferase n=1 Tax=Photobacterium marinum TaxID=1056511 RepID=L8J8W5_9GAMM|nr:lipid IV(A) 3-deoxy-D-manno-octulosonic acid transferase [Photobacterium marinum]ELR63999.1 3-deoxy-D-manno-octulosonic-acid transferase [Photobacterium marinum]